MNSMYNIQVQFPATSITISPTTTPVTNRDRQLRQQHQQQHLPAGTCTSGLQNSPAVPIHSGKGSKGFSSNLNVGSSGGDHGVGATARDSRAGRSSFLEHKSNGECICHCIVFW